MLIGLVLIGQGMLCACQPAPVRPVTPAVPAAATSAPAVSATATLPPPVPASATLPATSAPTVPALRITASANGLPTDEVPAMNETPVQTPYDAYVTNCLEQAKMDLSRRLSIPRSQIEVAAVTAVTWPDGSLGCPQPGMIYPQVQVDGMRILLRAGGRTYDYHSGGSRPPFLCEGAN